MDADVLIESIRSRVREDLTAEQVAEIRMLLADDPGLEKLLAPPGQQGSKTGSFDDLIGRMRRHAAARRRRRWLKALSATVLSLVVLDVLVLLMVVPRGGDRPAVPAPPARTADRKRPPPATAPTTRALAGATGAPTVAATDTRPAQSRPASKDQPPVTRSQLTWQDYLDPIVTKDIGWHKDAGRLLRPIGPSKLTLQAKGQSYALNGSYALGLLPDEGRMLRLGLASGECSLEFWNGRAGVRIDLKDKRPIAACTLVQPDRRRPPEIQNAFDDGGTWQWYRKGLIDVRYQDRQIVVCRGGLVLLAVPLPQPPDEGSISAKAVVRLAEVRPAKPLSLTADLPPEGSVSVSPAGKLDWRRPDGKAQVGVKFATVRGEVVLSAESTRTPERAWLEMASAASMDVVFHVRRALPGVGVFAEAPGGEMQLWLVLYNGRNVVVTRAGDRGAAARNAGLGFIVGSEFWCRVRYGLDLVTMSFSRDGVHWSRLHDRAIKPAQTMPPLVRMGVQVAGGRGKRSISVAAVRVRKYDALQRLGGAKLPATGAGSGKRVAAALRLLTDAAGRGGPAEHAAVLAGADELRLIVRARPDGALRTALRTAFESMGQTCLDAGDDQGMRKVLRRSYLRRVPLGVAPAPAAHVAPPGLVRLCLLDLVAHRQWQAARLESLRFLYLARNGAGGFAKDAPDRESVALAGWVMARADAGLRAAGGPGAKDAPLPVRWTHPLVYQPHRETLKIMSEFLVLVKDKNYAAACATLVRRPLPNRLIRTSPGAALLPSSHFQARRVISTTPQLRAILQEKHADVGMVRMTRARRSNDAEAMKAVAAQFFSTQAGFEARLALADLDLGSGGFSTAAADYKALAAEKAYSRRGYAAAKYRLASAMLGRIAGEAVREPVIMPGETFSVEKFEQMIQRLVKEHGTELSPVPTAVAPGPSPKGMVLAALSATSGSASGRDGAFANRTAFAADAKRLFVHHRGKLVAIDRKTRRALWTFAPAYRKPDVAVVGPARPMLVGKKLYARFLLSGRWMLVCLDVEKGKPVWQNAYGGHVVSDPILIDGRLQVISARPAPDDSLDLYLHSVHPGGGEASLSASLVRVRKVSPSVGRPAATSGGIVFRASGCLISCDLRGDIRWVRRLLTVPPDVSPRLLREMPSDEIIIREDGDMIFAAAGCPQVTCVNARTGELRWSRLFGRPVGVVAASGGGVIVAEAALVRALDPATGKTLWRRPSAAGVRGVLPAENGTVACVLLERPDPRRGPAGPLFRGLRWLSAKDGRVVREVKLATPSLYGAAALFTDGVRIFGLSNVEAKRAAGRLFVIKPK